MIRHVIVLFTVALATTSVSGQASCQYGNVALAAGKSVAVANPGYNRNYPANSNCNWKITAPVGYKVLLSCTDVVMPSTTNCASDRLVVNGNRYCDNGNFAAQSTNNVMDINLTTATANGRFFCNATTVEDPCNCGRRKTSRIVGGVETIVNEFPEQAYLKDSSGQVVCSATIISSEYAMTAAHCLTGASPSQYKLVVGDHNTASTTETNSMAVYDISKLIPHENYVSATMENDIGLIRLTKPIVYGEDVGPVCLPWKFTGNTFDRNVVTVAGWGTKEFAGPKSPTLQKVDLNTIPNSQCMTSYPTTLKSSMICTYTPAKDTCQHDSGSNLYYTDPSNSRLYSVGVVSGGAGCAGSKPSINMRVTSFLPWIKSNTPGAKFCSV